MRWVLAIVATLAFAPSAYAQGTVQADETNFKWVPDNVTIKAGETVTWNWTGFHNVKSTSTNWDVRGTTTGFQHPFPAPGTYTYVCEFHSVDSNGQPLMVGSVTVTDASGTPPPPPPPPPLSEQHWGNDQQPPSAFELVDQVRPELDRVRVARVRNGARVRFHVSERAQVVVRFKRGGIVVKSRRKTFGKGAGRLTVRDRRMHGRYLVEVLARDLSRNRSAVERDRVTIP
jgi:plastocyanin